MKLRQQEQYLMSGYDMVSEGIPTVGAKEEE
jgi:hypothetical protein